MNDDLNSAKHRYDLWKQDLHATLIRKEDMNKIIMNYFVTEGFAEVADKFRMESGTNPDIDFQTIMERDATRQAIEDGDIEHAIEKIKAFNPKILDANPQLSFHLQIQNTIELIRKGRIMEALEFTKEVAPRGEKNPEFLGELERTLTLLAFEDVTQCPHRHLLDMSLRNILAQEANAAMLISQNYHPDPILSHLLKMLKWLQDVVLFRYPRVADFTNPTYSLRI
ncbi:protein GID8 homolog isoform X1 [Cryptomeria japonica]|uniref:protein GID8 homolog isoform X1 n=2 Tax=Cryptomeria japonica TaxID=3369 RepID=UPI0027DA556D|nr:protein GID8 homolog isoform X1 [Cryptomeria japonica]